MIEVDCEFENAPLMLAIAHVSFTQSPEIIERITEVKSGLLKLGLPVAESKQQTRFSINLAAGGQRQTQNNFWWFTNINRSRAVAVAQNSLVLYDANYGKFSDFIGRFHEVSQLIEKTAGEGCFLQTIALRYVSGFQSDQTPSSFIRNGLQGLSTEELNTKHFHHEYKFWCEIEEGGKLVVSVKTVHGNQVIPQDVLSIGLVLDPKFSLQKEVDAIQFDIHETVQKKNVERYSSEVIQNILATMRGNLKTAFLAATTPEAHKQWMIKSN